MEIGDKVNFVFSMDIEGEKKILQGKINKIFENNCVLIEVISLVTIHEKATMGSSATVT